MTRPTQQDLVTLYRGMTEDQLLASAIEYDQLTEQAQAALRAEFAQRNMQPPELPDRQRPETGEFSVVGRYRDLPQAQLAKCALDSAGIPCFLRDENTIRLEWVWSNLMGGIRLQVAAADLEAAEAILAQPIPGTIATDTEDVFEQPCCPRCGSLDIVYETKNQKVGMASMYIGIPLLLNKDAWKCQTCDAEWQDAETE
jgi:hypothetical protein